MSKVEAFALQINSDCNRGCSHCFFEYDGKISFKELKNTLSQIAELIHNNPESFNNSVQLVGREILLYEDEGKNLGDVVDLIHSLDLRLGILTRGFSNQEKTTGSISYRNIVEFLRRFPNSHKPVTSVSFDTFNSNPELASEMAKNAITSFLTIDSYGPDIMVTTSVERAGLTYRRLVNLMESLNYNSHSGQIIDMNKFDHLAALLFGKGPAAITLFNSEEGLSDADIGLRIVKAYREQNPGRLRSKPTIEFYNENGRHISVTISDYDKSGKGSKLNETSMSPISHCSAVLTPYTSIFTVRPDQTMVACCSSNCMEIPAIGSLKESSLDELMSGYVGIYAEALLLRQNELGKTYARKGGSICSNCSNDLPRYLTKIEQITRKK